MKAQLKKILKPIYLKLRNFFFYPLDFYKFYKSQQLTQIQKKLIDELSFFKTTTKQANGILLIQYLKDYEYTLKFAAASKTYAQNNHLNVSFYDINWTRWIGWGNQFERLYNRYFTSYNKKIHYAFGDEIIFKCEEKFHDQNLIKEQLLKIKNELLKPEDVLTIKIESILVGDLIYDTYLRYFNEPTIENINENILKLIEISLNIFYSFTKMLSENNVKALFNSYTTYIEHGIPARICLAKGIKVYTFGSYSYIIQECTLDFPYHTINHTQIGPDKKIKERDIELAKTNFTARFKGVIDDATSYMKVSAFSDKPISENLIELFKNSERNVVIYTHDFYDSPHINRCLLFPDLYQFLKQTLDAIQEFNGTTYYIKTHPNSYGDCKERTIALVNSYQVNHFHILDDSVSNIHIINLKPNLIVTARGTVGAEMAHFKIPVVALYDNLYINFNFVHSCKELLSFYRIIIGQQGPVIDFDVAKIYSFYFQTYLEKVSHEKYPVILKLKTSHGQNHDDTYISNILNSNFHAWKNDLYINFQEALNQL